MSTRRVIVLALFLAAAAIGLTIAVAPRFLPGLRATRAPRRELPSLDGLAWLGAPPRGGTAGRPVALLLWSDTDPRGLDALRVVDGWHRAFAPAGVLVVAAHVPAFGFAADSAVAGRVARRLGLELPIALDPRLALEAALGGASDGPHLVVADARGIVRVDTVGLAGLAAGELALREAILAARPGAVFPSAGGIPVRAAARTILLGAGRVASGPLRDAPAGRTQVFTAEFRYQEQGARDVPYPVGAWTPGADGLSAARGGAANFVALRYDAARLGLVMSPPPGGAARVWVLRDDRWLAADARDADVREGAGREACVNVTEPRLYWVERGRGERVIKISPESAGITLHAFVLDETGSH